jgi:hypothetical protein
MATKQELIDKGNEMLKEIAVTQVARAILFNGAVKATKYVNEKLTVKATRKCYKRRIRGGAIDIVLTIGRPNFEERDFIKKLKKAGEPFPVKKVQLKMPK